MSNYPNEHQVPDDDPFWWSQDCEGRVWLKRENVHGAIIGSLLYTGMIWICEQKRFGTFVVDFDNESFIVKEINLTGYQALLATMKKRGKEHAEYYSKINNHKNRDVTNYWKAVLDGT